MKTSTFPGTFSIFEDDILPSWCRLKLGRSTNAMYLMTEGRYRSSFKKISTVEKTLGVVTLGVCLTWVLLGNCVDLDLQCIYQE